MIEMRDVRDELWEIVSGLYRVENRVASLAERLAPEAQHMWDCDRPTTVVAHLHAALQAVCGDYLAEALKTLMHAGRQSEESLYREYSTESGPSMARVGSAVPTRAEHGVTWSGGVSFRKGQQQPGEGAGRKEPPPCSD